MKGDFSVRDEASWKGWVREFSMGGGFFSKGKIFSEW
jgi:hypothetical protein